MMKKPTQDIQWQRVRFKANKVWLAMTPDGNTIVQNGKVLIKYQLDQEHEYWVYPKSIQALDSDSENAASSSAMTPPKPPRPLPLETSSPTHQDSQKIINIYTDGAASGNPGPAGIGVLLQYGTHEKEISNFIGNTTNNIAELEAIRVGLSELKDTQIPVRLYTDSAYAHGVLTLGWKAKKNQALIRSIKKIMDALKDLKLIKVKGHAGEEGNERADRLATSAIKKSQSDR